jgi:hypothetical protein
MPLTRSAVMAIAFAMLPVPMTQAQEAVDLAGDPERGKIVYRTLGGCVNCHGWPADGKTGVNLRTPPGPSLRESELDTEGLMEVIRCGRPGTPMPYHDRAAYRDDRCYGLVLSDFDSGSAPKRGKTIGEKDIINIVTYLQNRVIGLGTPTYEECADFFDNPAAKACDTLK